MTRSPVSEHPPMVNRFLLIFAYMYLPISSAETTKYFSAGTKLGTAIHVTRSELPSAPVWNAPTLSRCPYRFSGSTLRMPALAGNGQVIDAHALAVGTAILAAIWHRAVATRMLAFIGVLFGHEASLPPFTTARSRNGSSIGSYATAESSFRLLISSSARNQSTSGLPSGHPRCIQNS